MGIVDEPADSDSASSDGESPPEDTSTPVAEEAVSSNVEWIAADDINMSATQSLEGEEDENLWKVILGTSILFIMGFGGTLGLFFRRI